MVPWNEVETGLLVKLVQQREALYDVANEDYTNRDIVWALWTDIARQLNKTPTACRNKWTRLRCIYRRIINQRASSKRKKKIKWPWAHMMTFLIPHLKTIQPRYGPNVEIDDTESIITLNDYKSFTNNDNNFMTLNNFTEDFEMDEVIANSDDGVAEYLYYESGAESEAGGELPVKKPSSKKIKLEGTSQIKPESISIRMTPEVNYQADGEDEYEVQPETCCQARKGSSGSAAACHCDRLAGADADEMFFRSIVPDVKLLNQKDKGIFKLKVQQLLHDMLYSPKEDKVKVSTATNISI